MADQVKLTYTDPETSSTANTTLNVQKVSGWYDFDNVEFFPPIQNRYLSGNVDEQISGLRRIINVDFGVVSTFANRKAILYFLLDESRQLNIVMSAPTGFSAGAATLGGSLPDNTYYYRVTAVDNVGETTGATESSSVVAAPNSQVPLSWNAVSGAVKYRIYRTTSSGDYSGEAHYITEVTTNSYTDTGSIALTTTYVLPTVQALTVALVNPGGYANEWISDVQVGRRFQISLLDRTLRSTLIP